MSRILVVGDSYMSEQCFVDAITANNLGLEVDVMRMSQARPSLGTAGIREFEGDPAEVSARLAGHEILMLHGAPITRDVLEANPEVRFIGCARGGPVNVDVEAAHELGVTVTTSPGKNAAAVADLTIGFLISLLRNFTPSSRHLIDAAVAGEPAAESTFEGAAWFGRELSSTTLALVGLGNVARQVAERATALGMRVVGFDPYLEGEVPGVERVDSVGELAARADVLSVHARATSENRHMIDADVFSAMRTGSLFINTARESLVDESALLGALEARQLAGAAIDVFEGDGLWPQLVQHPRVLATPHIAGATQETLRRGAEMIVQEAARYLRKEELRWAI
ncbi:MAG: NAD(P)-dependent oxidoreductase [Actinomycetota bacterium]